MMINRKDTPAPFMHRAEPPPPMPQTPPNTFRTKRASKLARPTVREAFAGSNARGLTDEPPRDERISHDLSLTDNTRHSVVDNMLMSLNPTQPQSFSLPQDRSNFSARSDAVGSQRHLHSSSTNSENFTFPSNLSDESPDQRSFQHSGRGRRSNSSSNFQSALRRIDSVHVDDEAAKIAKGKKFQVKRPGAPEAPTRGHARKNSSKGSIGASSLNYEPMHSHSNVSTALNRRSASFDHGYGSGTFHSASSSGPHPPMPSNLSQAMMYHDSDAAPTPTVPGGPRRDHSPSFPSHSTQAAPAAPLQRKNSNKSSKSHTGRKTKDKEKEATPVPTANGFSSRRASKQTGMPGFVKQSRNPSPVRQVSEPVLNARNDQNHTRFVPNGTAYSYHDSRFDVKSRSREKEAPAQRPGFFRRVFGSSKGPTPSGNGLQTVQSNQGHSSHPMADSWNGETQPTGLHEAPAIEDLSHPPEPIRPTPPLQKKPSSFFRRRKKSVSENIPAPPLPLHHQQNTASTQREGAPRSSVSSLRQVMNPYLDGPSDIPPSVDTRLRGQPSPDSILLPPQDASTASEIRPSQPRDLPSPHLTAPSHQEYNSFLNDDSSTENRTPTEPTALVQSMVLDNIPPRSEPTSTHDDMKPRRAIPRDVLEASNNEVGGSAHNLDIEPNEPSSSASKAQSSWNSMKTRGVSSATEPTLSQKPQPPVRSVSNEERGSARPGSSSEDLHKGAPERSLDGVQASPVSDYHSASSSVHPLKRDDEVQFPTPAAEQAAQKPSLDSDPTEPSEDDRKVAQELFDGDESIATKENAAAWLGDPSPERARIRRAYIEQFHFQDLTILSALRGLCGKLYLKGEAQQVDRILDGFSTRWCACNPNHGFKAADVVHTICYSLLLLNTDLHQAEIETKMTRTQFLKNILPTIRRVVTDAAPDAFTSDRASTMPPARPWMEQSSTGSKSTPLGSPSLDGRRSFEGQRPVYRLSQRPSDQSSYTTTAQPFTPVDFASSAGDCGPLVKTGFHGKLNTWENQIELILKDFYNSIRQQSLPLHGSEAKEQQIPEAPQSSNSLSAMTNNMLRRTPSMLSKTGSENMSYSRGRQAEGRLGTGRWQSKTRSRPRLYPASTVASSRRSSFDEKSSVTSPSVASAWSKFSSFGKTTNTNFSVDSLGSHYPPADYQQSIGFANALSQAIIREEHPTGGDEESLRAAPLLEDEGLELAGAPWAKEGILKHKHHLEAIDKRAKDRNWVESFAVIEKGHMRLFSFNMNAKSLRQKNKSRNAPPPGGAVGGGNWAENAEMLGSFVLRQTIASALPPPGYSKTRPHVWALSLPTGAVHLFQVGTPEIVKEFVTTANYWSARLSKEPLVGGISNIEYGWGEGVINIALLTANHTENTPLPPPTNMSTVSGGAGTAARPSLQSSIRSARSSMDQASSSGFRPRLPGDRITINDWTPPQQSMVASALMEVDQLRQLVGYVRNIEEELQRHNELRGAMLLAFSPRHPNHTRAMTNWERKSSYLLREIVKFRTYIDCLQAAQALKEQIYADRAESKMVKGTDVEGLEMR